LRNIQAVPSKVPDILTRHVPNVLFSKYTSRKTDLLTVNLTDDSNIEYNNIFPSILSKNKKIAVNVSLERQADRNTSFILNSNTPHPNYTPTYKLIDKKINVPNFSGKQSFKNLPSLLSPRDQSNDRNNNPENQGSPREETSPAEL
jgi:hypothetical protein